MIDTADDQDGSGSKANTGRTDGDTGYPSACQAGGGPSRVTSGTPEDDETLEEHCPKAWRCRGDIAADEIIDENMAEMRKDAHIDNWLCDQLSDRVRAPHSKSVLEPPRRARPSGKLPGWGLFLKSALTKPLTEANARPSTQESE